VSGATPDKGQVQSGAQRAKGIAEENPLGLAIGAAAVGFVAGLLVPTTRVEDEKIGPVADQVKEKAKETGQEALKRGKHVAQQAAETAKEAGQEQAEELRSSAQDKAGDVQPSSR
jgi:gas vesicle protein